MIEQFGLTFSVVGICFKISCQKWFLKAPSSMDEVLSGLLETLNMLVGQFKDICEIKSLLKMLFEYHATSSSYFYELKCYFRQADISRKGARLITATLTKWIIMLFRGSAVACGWNILTDLIFFPPGILRLFDHLPTLRTLLQSKASIWSVFWDNFQTLNCN